MKLEPNDLVERFWDDRQLCHHYNTGDMEYREPEFVAFATAIMTMTAGEVITCGTNHKAVLREPGFTTSA